MSHPVADYISEQFRALWHHLEEQNKSHLERYENGEITATVTNHHKKV